MRYSYNTSLVSILFVVVVTLGGFLLLVLPEDVQCAPSSHSEKQLVNGRTLPQCLWIFFYKRIPVAPTRGQNNGTATASGAATTVASTAEETTPAATASAGADASATAGAGATATAGAEATA